MGKPLMTRHCMLDINTGKENIAMLDINTKLSKPPPPHKKRRIIKNMFIYFLRY